MSWHCARVCTQDVPHVVEVDGTLRLIGGINIPVQVRTTDSHGRSQKQLCKCNDDLRQVSWGQAGVLRGGVWLPC
jgi:hypothetical protein